MAANNTLTITVRQAHAAALLVDLVGINHVSIRIDDTGTDVRPDANPLIDTLRIAVGSAVGALRSISADLADLAFRAAERGIVIVRAERGSTTVEFEGRSPMDSKRAMRDLTSDHPAE
jgi:hypothetical protein